MPTSHGVRVRERGNQPWKKAQERKTGSTSGILTEQPSRKSIWRKSISHLCLGSHHQTWFPLTSSHCPPYHFLAPATMYVEGLCITSLWCQLIMLDTHTHRARERSWNYCSSFSPAKFVWFTYSVVERNHRSGDHLLLSVYKKRQNNGQHLQKKEVAQPSPEFFATEWGTSGALYPSILPSLDYHTP